MSALNAASEVEREISKIITHRDYLERSICIRDMWCYMRQHSVICQEDEERMKWNAATRQQVSAVLNHLVVENKLDKLRGFYNCLVETDQQHILESLGLQSGIENIAEVPAVYDITLEEGYLHGVNLWDKNNNECQNPLQEHRKLFSLLREKRVFLVKNVDLKAIWCHLRQYDVVDQDREEELKIFPTQQQVERLLDCLLKSPMWRFHSFLKSLVETGQKHILEGLYIDPVVYGETDYQNDDILNVITTLIQHYVDCARNCNVMKYVYRSPKVELEKTYVKLLLLSGIGKVVGGHRLDDRRIDETQIFDLSSLNTLVEGDPGIGKTFIALHLTHVWMKQNKNYQLKDIELVILIRPTDARDTVEETIMAALKGSDREKRTMFAFWKRHPKQCCFIVDAIDEFSSKVNLVKEIFNLMENKASYFIVMCRTQHPVLDSRTDVFQRIIQVAGFGENDIKPFIRKFLTEPEQEVPDDVERICQVVLHDKKLTGLFCNPLVACLMCLLIAEKHFTAESLSSLTLLEIYKKIEELILKRDCQVITEAMQRELSILHGLALKSLLLNKLSYSMKELNEHGIAEDSLVLVFLHKDQTPQLWFGLRVSYHWLHRSFMEFAAAMAIEALPTGKKRLLIQYICSRRELNHVAHFLGYLYQDNNDLLSLVCKATLAFQLPIETSGNCLRCLGDTRKCILDLDINGILGQGGSFSDVIAKEIVPCQCFSDIITKDVSQGSASFHQAMRCLLSANQDDMKITLTKECFDPFLPIKWKFKHGGYVHMVSVPDSSRFVKITEEHVCWNEFYYQLVDVRDLLTSGALHQPWLSTDTMGPLAGLALDFSDPDMVATFGYRDPTSDELDEVLTAISEQLTPVLSSMCSLLLMYPTQANIEPALKVIRPRLLRKLYSRGIRRFIIWVGRTSSVALIEWLDEIEKEFDAHPIANLIGNWMRIKDNRGGVIQRATNILLWGDSLEMELLFYGLNISIEANDKAHIQRLKACGVFQHSHWGQHIS